MDYPILPPTDDWIFKLLFGDERNKSILISFLKSLVDLPDEEVEDYFNCFRFYNPGNGQCFEEIPEEIYTLELAKEFVALRA